VHHEGFIIVDVHGDEFSWSYYRLADNTH
jgi:hypothetical protein